MKNPSKDIYLVILPAKLFFSPPSASPTLSPAPASSEWSSSSSPPLSSTWLLTSDSVFEHESLVPRHHCQNIEILQIVSSVHTTSLKKPRQAQNMECVTSFTDILLDSASCQVLLIICIIIIIIMVKMAIATMTMKMMLTKVVN